MAGEFAFDDDMAAYYAEGAEEQRLFTWYRPERVRTEVLLERFLPAPPSLVIFYR